MRHPYILFFLGNKKIYMLTCACFLSFFLFGFLLHTTSIRVVTRAVVNVNLNVGVRDSDFRPSTFTIYHCSDDVQDGSFCADALSEVGVCFGEPVVLVVRDCPTRSYKIDLAVQNRNAHQPCGTGLFTFIKNADTCATPWMTHDPSTGRERRGVE